MPAPGNDDGSRLSGTSGAVVAGGDTNLVLYATDTPTPSPTPTQEPPTPTPRTLTARRNHGSADALRGHQAGHAERASRAGNRSTSASARRRRGRSCSSWGGLRTARGCEVCCMANQPVWVRPSRWKRKTGSRSAVVLTPPPVPPPTPTRRPVAAAPRTGQSPLAAPLPVGTPLPPFDVAPRAGVPLAGEQRHHGHLGQGL